MGNRPRPRPQHDPAYRRLCELLRTWRLEADLTQAELGAVFDRPHTFVHKCEAGDRRLDPVEFVRWCRACGVKPEKAIAQLAAKVRK
ncbi:MAG: helix-turn-helix transcriptional regulator [Phycisphaeraceae bacterium]|nr:helix-turn-helix transcriptional regulator [Phycisphaeraceae bacterium]